MTARRVSRACRHRRPASRSSGSRQSADPHDCSIREHIGLQGSTFNGFQTCRFVVTAIKPQEVITHPAPQVGWCR